MPIVATSYEEIHFKTTKRTSMLLTNIECNSSENNLTSCCASEISSSAYCHSGAYAGVRCKLYNNFLALLCDIITIWYRCAVCRKQYSTRWRALSKGRFCFNLLRGRMGENSIWECCSCNCCL